MVEFGQKLRELRTQRQLTQKQLAELVGCQHSIISFYELGDRVPSPDVIVKLSKIFSVTSDYLLGIERHETIDISQLTDSDKNLVRQLIHSLSEKAHK